MLRALCASCKQPSLCAWLPDDCPGLHEQHITSGVAERVTALEARLDAITARLWQDDRWMGDHLETPSRPLQGSGNGLPEMAFDVGVTNDE